MAETDRQRQLAEAMADAIKVSGYLDREGDVDKNDEAIAGAIWMALYKCADHVEQEHEGVAHAQALRGLTGALRDKLGQF